MSSQSSGDVTSCAGAANHLVTRVGLLRMPALALFTAFAIGAILIWITKGGSLQTVFQAYGRPESRAHSSSSVGSPRRWSQRAVHLSGLP